MKTKPSCPKANFHLRYFRIYRLHVSQEEIARRAGLKLRSYQRHESANTLPLNKDKRAKLLEVFCA